MVDNRQVQISSLGFKEATKPQDGRNFHWTTDINVELPIKMTRAGLGSETPLTLPQLFIQAKNQFADLPALNVERDGKKLSWTWKQYYQDVMSFAKSMAFLNLKERSAVAIMGFNSPEWVISFMGGITYNCVGTGIYITNAADACFYQTEHAEASLVMCETNENLKKFDLEKLPLVKAVVVWGEKELPAAYKGNNKVYLWKDFIKLGASVKDEVIFEKMNRQKPGECCCLIYTSGTTGRPKGCMLSHDNLTWCTHPNSHAIQKACPEGFQPSAHRVVSYLPLSHIAGLAIDFCLQLKHGH